MLPRDLPVVGPLVDGAVVAIARRFHGPDSPSWVEALYLANACGDLIADGRARRLASTVYETDRTQIVLRHDAFVSCHGPVRDLVYLIDDDWEALAREPAIPVRKRLTIAFSVTETARRLIPRARCVLVTSHALEDRVRALCPRVWVERIGAVWTEPLAPLDHFDGEEVRLLLIGTDVHRRDTATLVPVLPQLLARWPRLSVTVGANLASPERFAGHPRIVVRRPTSFPDYRRWLASQRFHLGLLPLRDTPLNRARSDSKLCEFAIVGAAPVVSGVASFAAAGDAGERMVILDNDPQAWLTAIDALLADRARMRALAAANQAHVDPTRRAERQRALWQRLLFAGAAGHPG